MKDKKGFLLAEETIKMVIGVICIVLLVYLLFAIYNSKNDKLEREQALASLKLVKETFEKNISQVEIFNPEDFFVVSWPNDGEIPSKCSNLGWENCMCVCKTKFYHRNIVKNFAKDCDDWACEQTSEKIILANSTGIKIEKSPVILVFDYSDGIRISRR